MIERIKNEPALVTGLVASLIALGVAFGLDLTREQSGAIMAVVIAVLAFVTRAQVTPTRTVAAEQPPEAPSPVAGPASDVPQGEPVEVVPVEDGEGL